jgi:3-mercaptopropionate dioxygenase
MTWRGSASSRGSTITPHGACSASSRGVEHEKLFDAYPSLVGRNENHVGDVSCFPPPRDIHRVRNSSDATAISIHVYDTDFIRIGSSRRYYD